ncbi:MAG: hypothetical protein ARM1_0155 [Candidatus Micrarchaeota archaeon]|nr:MAG: hypothetical protein ARM1_0155 [Candidatus Micrarchaeota archaeon]
MDLGLSDIIELGIALLLALALIFISVSVIQGLSFRYGIAAEEAYILSNSSINSTALMKANQSYTSTLITLNSTLAVTITALRLGIDLAFIMLFSSLVILLAYTSTAIHIMSNLFKRTSKYILVAIISSIIYIMSFIFINLEYQYTFTLLTIITLASASIIIGISVQLLLYGRSSSNRYLSSIKISPNEPYSNIIKLRDALFNRFKGSISLLDKHFNSTALENLYRLLSDNGNIGSIRVITSKEMLDNRFYEDYKDIKREFENRGISFNIYIMNDRVAEEQHERFIFDSEVAYKIPPLNIINKKSEHIVRMPLRDAEERFKEVLSTSTKIENLKQ